MIPPVGLLLLAAVATGPASSAPRASTQLVVVLTPAWDSVRGSLQRYERRGPRAPWTPVGGEVAVVVGASGLAWGADTLGRPREPRKREGDGRAPAGMFPFGAVFGFAEEKPDWVRLPFLPLRDETECVDDRASAHYNSVVDRDAVRRVDWRSSERMRRIEQYRLGVVVSYNAAPVRRGRGSCIFLHVWAGPATGTAGCTAMPEEELERVVRWLDPQRRPMLVQLTTPTYGRLRARWSLP